MRELLVPIAYENDAKNYPTKDKKMINRVPIVTSDATGTDMDNTKCSPFHKYFAVDMNFCGIFCIISLGGLQFGCMPNHAPK